MNTFFFKLAKLLWPQLDELSFPRQLVGVGDVITSIYSSIIFLTSLIWLYRQTEVYILQQHWPVLLLLLGLIMLFSYLNFFMIIEFREDRYGSANGSFNSMAVWTAVFIYGPTALWLMLIVQSVEFVIGWRHLRTPATRWNGIRDLFLTLAGFTLPFQIGLWAYEAVGGVIPIGPITINTILAGMAGILVNYFVLMAIWAPYFVYAIYTQRQLSKSANIRPVIQFFIRALSLPTIAHPFAIMAASLYSQSGPSLFMFYVVGLVVVAYLARQFSRITEAARQQARQLEKLELLGRDILNSPPDGSNLPEILTRHIPNMFPSGNVAIWLLPGQTLYQAPEDWEIDFVPIWDWTMGLKEAKELLANEQYPWDQTRSNRRPIICAPILAHEGTEVIGGIYLELRQLAQPWDRISLRRLFPGMHTLGDQISSVIHQAEEYAQTIALQKVSQELQIAGQIQASFLPNQFPNIPGWQLAVTLEPAGGLSGDFFDLIPLSRGRLGIVIADVADKGLGAALYMALCRTLIRTYALEYHARPDLVFSETNERILSDARANLFITCFYGVLDPAEGSLIYCNAGHNPPYLIGPANGNLPVPLTRTGMPIGIEEEALWERETIQFSPGDKLILYTDGITEAQNDNDEFFEDTLLLQTLKENPQSTAFEMQEIILDQVKDFSGGTPQFDDITLMILEKENRSE